jgi:hypothetical protein
MGDERDQFRRNQRHSKRDDVPVLSADAVGKVGDAMITEGRACGFVVGVIVCAFLVALLYFGLQWALSGMPE